MCETSYKLEHRPLSLTSQDLVLVEWPSSQKCTMMIVNSNTKSVLLQLEDEYLQQRYDGSLVELVRDSFVLHVLHILWMLFMFEDFFHHLQQQKTHNRSMKSVSVCVCVCSKLQLVTIKLGTRILSLLREQFGLVSSGTRPVKMVTRVIIWPGSVH